MFFKVSRVLVTGEAWRSGGTVRYTNWWQRTAWVIVLTTLITRPFDQGNAFISCFALTAGRCPARPNIAYAEDSITKRSLLANYLLNYRRRIVEPDHKMRYKVTKSTLKNVRPEYIVKKRRLDGLDQWLNNTHGLSVLTLTLTLTIKIYLERTTKSGQVKIPVRWQANTVVFCKETISQLGKSEYFLPLWILSGDARGFWKFCGRNM